ncbi:MAG: hypothetical protein IJY92_04205 [Alphaproteobacteria bacterium]|nr:hypothetical protein [Alphaproteobacteria bacterium]
MRKNKLNSKNNTPKSKLKLLLKKIFYICSVLFLLSIIGITSTVIYETISNWKFQKLPYYLLTFLSSICLIAITALIALALKHKKLFFICLISIPIILITTITINKVNQQKHVLGHSCFDPTLHSISDKPIIYLYPTEKTKITVTVGNPQNLTHTYPKYETGWTVTAEPNGNLTDPKTNKHYYALYWEGKNTIEPNLKEGFVVKGKDTIPFLEEKLAQLGLNEREANEFIIYWLPKLESSPYNFIRFQTLEEQNQNMPLEVTPQPDTLIRVMMEFKNLVTPIIVTEQVLPPTPKRTGFTLVEWGGTDVTDTILK